ncbi:hypothetical protein NQ317_019380 [Molorchus minor]|uniref:Uncharacterized protein n=1 Tax=Molorchus minor TaxID=1323400 RepID=A0ABQ9JEZ2_9CUCU|nr:hypothetical protein NQ317_019380 [Molorchus minor]
MNSFNLSRCNKRFDFGVPLEDIFPPNDIHPRLKYLFEEAYRVFLKKDFTIHQLLRQYQGPLEIRLKLKEKIIFDTHYHIRSDNDDEYPGMYFLGYQAFSGLAPHPLAPGVCKRHTFYVEKFI